MRKAGAGRRWKSRTLASRPSCCDRTNAGATATPILDRSGDTAREFAKPDPNACLRDWEAAVRARKYRARADATDRIQASKRPIDGACAATSGRAARVQLAANVRPHFPPEHGRRGRARLAAARRHFGRTTRRFCVMKLSDDHGVRRGKARAAGRYDRPSSAGFRGRSRKGALCHP